MKLMPCLLLPIYLVLSLGLVRRAHAQLPGRTVRVMAIDSTTGQVLFRTKLWERRCGETNACLARAAQADSNGVIQLDSVLAWPVQVVCAGPEKYSEHTLVNLDSLQIATAAAADTTTLRMDATSCDRRPLIRRFGEWVGHYVPGFESSDLTLCDVPERKIWVAYSKDFNFNVQPQWPEGNDRYYPTYFVSFRGRLLGPGIYGHLGVADYLLTVDSVLFVRPPSKKDCLATPHESRRP